MKIPILTEELRQKRIEEINSFGADKHIDMARKIIDYCCFDFTPHYHRMCTELVYQSDEGALRVICSNYHYEITGVSTSIRPGCEVVWQIKKEYSIDEIYLIINEIKLFFMGKPNDCVLFTGAFCPPHIGHRNLIEKSINDGYDYAIIAISSQEFVEKKFKKAGDSSGVIYTEAQRLLMMLAMTYDIPNVLIYGPERGYTYEVLCNVKKSYNIQRLSFACGSDKLNEVHKWGYHDKLFNEYGFYILQRGNDTYNEIAAKCNSLFTRYKIVKKAEDYADISSTNVRGCIKTGTDYDGLVTKKVAETIKKF